jgi:hypothetical protein
MGAARPFRRWATPSELGDYAYCPRAWFWKRNPEQIPQAVPYELPREAFERGLQVHAQMEAADASPRVASRLPYGVAVAAGVLLLLVVLLWLTYSP